jgi:hypothetical protein
MEDESWERYFRERMNELEIERHTIETRIDELKKMNLRRMKEK